ncbi:dienelactone hydrolase family protein [Phaeobacter gallaeciensis]|uniref:dienelactone hydrolase family protein n=1 Tax=Phaeobacter gallaeciensis TaxID=60890 RepID=UPI000BBBE549|nr:dienelactone hydrolase family protein [Phaeobacter gallaeciensis]ATF20614.1 Dienelactone hydrolase [Phaeobacter gallaeciensis]ATF24723.1 Dienelactone hydrolase [Phaeobacter gallaeciensis]
MAIDSKTISITAADGQSFSAYRSRPASRDAIGGIILVQEIFGVNNNIRAASDWFATQGYDVIAPDMFWRQERDVELNAASEEDRNKAMALMQGFDLEASLGDMDAAANLLREDANLAGKIGVVGYCLGGRVAFRMAASDAADAVVCFYPVAISQDLATSTGPQAPLLIHLGAEDHLCPPEAQAAITEHVQKSDTGTVTVHDGVGHAFARLGRSGRAEEAAVSAEAATLDFFKKHLGA